MERPTDVRVEGIVLRTMAYREADVIATLYTRERGKIGVIAYGARKLRSRAKSAVQPFQSGTYILRPSGSLYRFVQAETVGAAALWGDVERMAQASVVAEWIVKGEEEGRPDEALYRLVRWALDRLLAGDEAETVVRTFELLYLRKAGFGPEWGRCVRCGQAAALTDFSPAEGGVVCRACRNAVPDARPVPPPLFAFVGRLLAVPPGRLGRVTLRPPQRQALSRLLDAFIERHVALDLRSRRLMAGREDLAAAAAALRERRLKRRGAGFGGEGPTAEAPAEASPADSDFAMGR
ncbi:DNA repair protein RecO [Hydrogenibacillus sp. N12]|uniref:DNA repair protein RecO n=1 Tax=Hydrogenibacillus sp. N12 TaxID=2866627 RepID=UPI001C7CEF87|nr:DNA repair protein RecO [Hydrogenibacillus sp. N12]QZA32233.1 DNA repair protein RecO [Hydrogenibacillus sp. N12]